jgi:alanyl-tRNA synthetase
MEKQRKQSQESQKKQVISVTAIETATPTKFISYENLQTESAVQEVVAIKDKTAVVLDTSPFYAEMGGQVGDTGEITGSGNLWRVVNTQKAGNAFLHFIDSTDAPGVGSQVQLSVDPSRRNAIQRHHTVTHLFHWALHEVASKDALQKGSYVGPEKLTFDFNSAPLTPQQIRDIEKLVNERIVENGAVSWTEIPYSEAKSRGDITHLFGEKYGDRVRVVQIGGDPQKLNGYSMELCGGTHTRSTGEIGLFRIVGENAIAAGVRRIEAIAGPLAYAQARQDADLLVNLAGKVSSPLHELEQKIDSLLIHQKNLERTLKAAQQREAAHIAKSLLLKARSGAVPAIVENLGSVSDGEEIQNVADAIKAHFHGVIVLGGFVQTSPSVTYQLDPNDRSSKVTNIGATSVALVAAVTPDFTSKIQAGKIIQAIAPIVGGKGGGRPESARGGGKDSSKINDALAKAAEMIAQTK